MRSTGRGRLHAALAAVLLVLGLLAPAAVTVAPAGALPVDPPTNLSPASTDVYENPVLTWDRMPGIDRYRVQMSVDPAFSSTLFNVVTRNTTYAPPDELPAGDLYWRVASVDGDGNGPFASAVVTKVAAGPTLTSPADGASFAFPFDPLTFTWSRIQGARSYVLEIDDATDFIGAASYKTTSPTFTVPTTMEYDQPFYWRVRGASGTNGGGLATAWSEVRTFTVTWEEQPALLHPPDTTLTTLMDVILVWDDVPGAKTYELEVGIDSNFNTTPAISKTNLVNTVYIVDPPLPAGSYFWRVRARDVDGHIGSWSATHAFTTGWVPGASEFGGWNGTGSCPPAWGNCGGPWGDGTGPWGVGGVYDRTVPELVYPPNAGTNANPMHFEWLPVVRAGYYEVQLDTSPTFNTPTTCRTLQTQVWEHNGGKDLPGGCSIFGEIDFGVAYYWRVRGIDDGTGRSTLWSSSRWFVRGSLAPTITAPVDGTTIDTPVVAWDRVEGVEKYRVTLTYLPPAGSPTQVERNLTFATSWSPDNSIDAGDYEVEVTAIDDDGHETVADTVGFTYAPLTPGASLTLASPTAGEASLFMPSMQWTPVTDAAKYRIYVTPLSTGIEQVQATGVKNHAFTERTSGGWLFPGTYSWRVEAQASDDTVLASGSGGLFTIVPPDPPTYLTPDVCLPPASCLEETSSPYLSWEPTGATEYTIYIAFDAFFTNVDRTYTTPHTRFVPREELTDNNVGQAYYWFVQSCLPNGYCTQSPVGVNADAGGFRKTSRSAVTVSPDDLGTTPDEPVFTWRHYLQTNLEGPGSLPAPPPFDSYASLTDDLEAKQYKIEVSTVPSFSSTIDSVTTNLPLHTPTTKTYPEGPLYWRVRAIDSSNNDLTWSAEFLTTKASPLLTGLLPADTDVVQGQPTFTWDPQDGAATYTLEVYKDADTNYSAVNRVLNQTTEQVQYTPTTDLPVGDYAWRLRRNDADNKPGPWTDGGVFTIDEASLALLGPADGTLFVDDDIVFTWDTAPVAARYRFQRSNTPAFTSLNENQTTVLRTWAPTSQYTDGIWYWRVQALDGSNNVIGTSPMRTIERRTPTVPDPPTAVTGAPGDGEVTVSWTAPTYTGWVPLTGYTVTASPDGATCATGGALSCTVTGLTNGQAYTFTVVATNSVGDSDPSVASAPVTPAAVPGAPTDVIGSPGNAQVAVTWTAPADTGGSLILAYTVTASPGGATCTTAGSIGCTVTGLTNGQAYTFTVVATNTVGDGPPSAASPSVTPRTVPDPPTGVAGTPGDEQVTVSWVAPADDGGAPITAYTATASPGGATCATPGTLSCTVTGLTNGQAYTFTVRAANVAGYGSPSAASAPVTPVGLPGAATAVVGTPDDSAVDVTWTAPTDTGGLAITGYTVTASPGGATCTTAGTIGCTVTGLSNGQAYTFTVVATNSQGDGPPSAASAPVAPRTVPGAPTSPVAVAGDGEATVSWSLPSTDGGASITGYTVTASPGGATCVTAGLLSCTVAGLTNGQAYTFTVVATNVAGDGSPSSATAPVTPLAPPGAPTAVSGTPGDGQVALTWVAPADDGGATITTYTATASPGGASCATAGTVGCTVTGLTNGQAYTFTVVATNSQGDGSPSAASAPVTPRTVPGAPTGVAGTPGNEQITVSWAAPASDGGAAITGYAVTASPGGATCTTGGTLACTVTGLTNGQAYTFTVVATNVAGDGPPSSASAPTTPGLPSECGIGQPGPFPDVPGTHPFCEDIEWLASTGVTGGYADGTFRPTNAVSRQAMAAFLYRYAGSPSFTPPGVASFPDVPTTHPFFLEIEWLASTGITGGYVDGTFRPNNAVSRQSMAAFLYRFAGSPAFSTPGVASFPDVPTTHPFFLEIEWLASTGITGGYVDGTFRPTNPVTRQAMAAFLHRYDGLGL